MENQVDRAAEEIAMFCRLYMHTKKDLPIRSSEMGLLIYLSKEQEEVTPMKVSQFFRIAKPTVTAMINVLIQKEFIIKSVSSADRRSYFISLSEKGKSLVASTGKAYYEQIVTLEAKMGIKEFHQFLELLSQANRILSEVENR